jgi:hypothetical protein
MGSSVSFRVESQAGDFGDERLIRNPAIFKRDWLLRTSFGPCLCGQRLQYGLGLFLIALRAPAQARSVLAELARRVPTTEPALRVRCVRERGAKSLILVVREGLEPSTSAL